MEGAKYKQGRLKEKFLCKNYGILIIKKKRKKST